MNRDDLHAQIEALPLFEKRPVWVDNSPTDPAQGRTLQTQSAICEIGQTRAWAFCSEKYRVVQFAEVLSPVLQSVEGEVEGSLTNYGGSVSMTVFPKQEGWQSPENLFGLVARNAVDKSGSIVVKFCVQHGPWTIRLPAAVAGLHKAHTGAAATLVKDYAAMVGKVQAAWTAIVTKFPTYPVYPATLPEGMRGVALPDLCARLKLGQRSTRTLTRACQEARGAGRDYTLWDAFVGLLAQVSQTHHKSGWHTEQALDRLCGAVFDYAVALSL